MSDFLLGFHNDYSLNKVIEHFSYVPSITIETYKIGFYDLIICRPDDWKLWGPYRSEDKNIFIALSGRIACDHEEWMHAKKIDGTGGLACKVIYNVYRTQGVEGLTALNGAYIVFVYDASKQDLYLITDRCGMAPCFRSYDTHHNVSFSSHPDVLARYQGIQEKLDKISLSEFLITDKVSAPYSYYKGIFSLDYGSIYTINMKDMPHSVASKKYFDFPYNIDPSLTQWDLAEELSDAFKKAINRRIHPMFGQTAVSLSGGLDSRTLLCSAVDPSQLWACCFFDEENLEYAISKKIAQAAKATFYPLKRDFDHYGNSAEMGVRICGGMGDLCSNHYLGFYEKFEEIGIKNLLAGFYCDYLFKGLATDRLKNNLFNLERLAPFNFVYYAPHFWITQKYNHLVHERLDVTFPEVIRKDLSDLGRLRFEQKRLFPLCYEPDNQESTVPAKTLGWYLPIVDNNVIDVYLKIPPRYKLNASLFSKMCELQCGKKISSIMNINTRSRVNASYIEVMLNKNSHAIRRRILGKKNTIGTEVSWQNWDYYLLNSKRIQDLWEKKSTMVSDVFHNITGEDIISLPIDACLKKNGSAFFLRMLSLKIWLEQLNSQ